MILHFHFVSLPLREEKSFPRRAYKVVVTDEAEEDLNQFIQYLLFIKKNKQAARNVLDLLITGLWPGK